MASQESNGRKIYITPEEEEEHRRKTMSPEKFAEWQRTKDMRVFCKKCGRTFPVDFFNLCPHCRTELLPVGANVPQCPTCHSYNVDRISDLSRGIHAAAFGLFSSTARSQFKCNNCGYKW